MRLKTLEFDHKEVHQRVDLGPQVYLCGPTGAGKSAHLDMMKALVLGKIPEQKGAATEITRYSQRGLVRVTGQFDTGFAVQRVWDDAAKTKTQIKVLPTNGEKDLEDCYRRIAKEIGGFEPGLDLQEFFKKSVNERKKYLLGLLQPKDLDIGGTVTQKITALWGGIDHKALGDMDSALQERFAALDLILKHERSLPLLQSLFKEANDQKNRAVSEKRRINGAIQKTAAIQSQTTVATAGGSKAIAQEIAQIEKRIGEIQPLIGSSQERQQRLSELQENLKEKREELENAENRMVPDAVLSDMKAKIAMLHAGLPDKEALEQKHKESVGLVEQKGTLEAEAAHAQETVSQIENLTRQMERRESDLQNESRYFVPEETMLAAENLLVEIESATIRLSQEAARIAQFKGLFADICAAARQFNGSKAERIRQLQEEISELDRDLQRLKGKPKPDEYTKRIEDVAARILALDKEIRDGEQAWDDFEKAQNGLNETLKDHAQASSDTESYQRSIAEINEKIAQIPPIQDVSALEKERADLETRRIRLKEIHEQQVKREKNEEDLRRLEQERLREEIWIEAMTELTAFLGPKGLMSSILQESVKPFTVEASLVLKRMGLDYDFSVHFYGGPAGDREIFDLGMARQHMDGEEIFIPFDCLSSGRQLMFTVAMLGALALYITAGWKPLIVDDICLVDVGARPQFVAAIESIADRFDNVVVVDNHPDGPSVAINGNWQVIQVNPVE